MTPQDDKPNFQLGDDGEFISDVEVPVHTKRKIPRWQRNLEWGIFSLLLMLLCGLILWAAIQRRVNPVALLPTDDLRPTQIALQQTQTIVALTLFAPTKTYTRTVTSTRTPQPTKTTPVRPTLTFSPTIAVSPTTGITPISATLTVSPTRGASPCSYVFERETGMRFAFISITGSDSGLYLMNYGGQAYSAMCRMLDMAPVYRPVWSPDGRAIVFEGYTEQSMTQDTSTVFVVNADGNGLRNIAPTSRINRWATWSPDSKWVGYVSLGYEGERMTINAVNLDTGKLIQFYATPRTGSVSPPRWSPDGKQVLFEASSVEQPGLSSDNAWEIFSANADGSEIQQLTKNDAYDADASWSADGKQILFYSQRDEIKAIYLMNVDGSNVQRLTDPGTTNSQPLWSPNGKTIAFVSKRTGNSDIWLMNRDGSDQRQLTKSAAEDGGPVWSPDGYSIIFIREVDSNMLLFVMNADGTNVQQITDHYLGNSYAVSFQPLKAR
jgi:TolB protein